MIRLLHTLKRRPHGEHGFTLLEMIIALVIISILAATAAIVGSNQAAKAKETTVTNDVKNIADEIKNGWNEDEGYPTAFTQKLSDGNTATLLSAGEFAHSGSGADGNTGNHGGSTGGGGNSNENGGTNGNGDGTYKPTTNRQLTWAEFRAANKYDTGIPFAAQGANNRAGKVVGSTMSFDFNYTAANISSSAELLETLQDACATVYFGYNRFLPSGTDSDTQGQNLCHYLREQDNAFTAQQALELLSVFKLTSNSQADWSVAVTNPYGNADTSSVPFENVVDWSFPTAGTYTVIVTKNPTSLSGCWRSDGSDAGWAVQSENVNFTCSSGEPFFYSGATDSRQLYDVAILYTSATDQAFSSRPTIYAAPGGTTDDGTPIWSQGGRYCYTVAVGSGEDCGRFNNGQQFSQSDDLPESWWSSYLNGTGNTGGSNTNPSTDGANGGAKASAANNTYNGAFCVEAHNEDVDKWYFYASDQQKVKEGRCPRA